MSFSISFAALENNIHHKGIQVLKILLASYHGVYNLLLELLYYNIGRLGIVFAEICGPDPVKNKL